MTALHSFDGDADGFEPVGSLVVGNDGSFYGTASGGRPGRLGTIFRLTRDGVFTVLHSFAAGNNGSTPTGALIQAADGNFYGTTTYRGANGAGTLFQLTPDGVFMTLHSFPGQSDEGGSPMAALIQGGDGSLYGTASSGGAHAGGTVFKVTLGPPPSTFFADEVPIGNGAYYLDFASGNPFGYYVYLSDPHYLYHFDLGL